MSSKRTRESSVLPMAVRKSKRMRVPNGGGDSRSFGPRSTMSKTSSTTKPSAAVPPTHSASTTTMHVVRVGAALGRASLIARSTTGSTRPRTLVTPRMHAGVEGISVVDLYSMISRTFRTGTPKRSPPSAKVMYWAFMLAAHQNLTKP